MNKKACVYFMQGWSDIIMSMALINYYRLKYSEITVLMRSDSKELIDFYVRTLDNVKIIYFESDNGRFYGNIVTGPKEFVEIVGNTPSATIIVPNDFEMMFHAEHDKWRKDQYKYYWYQSIKKPTNHFSEAFYVYYDIDFMVRNTYFSIDRDITLEEKRYQEFIKIHGVNYIIYHDDENNHLYGEHHVSTKIDFGEKVNDYKYVNLNRQSKVFFDYIRIIQNAKEIHLVDSIWGVICYQLDAKYGLFKDKKIKVYCKRGHQQLFLSPTKLDNWELL